MRTAGFGVSAGAAGAGAGTASVLAASALPA
jgi:hypothetical protein